MFNEIGIYKGVNRVGTKNAAKKPLLQIFICIVFLTLGGCNYCEDHPQVFKTFVPIEDLQQIPQNADYISHLVHDTPESIEGGNQQNYRTFVLRPWSFIHLADVNPEQVASGFLGVFTDGYRENLHKWSESENDMNSIKENANFAVIDTLKKRGVMVANANLRQLPTDLPSFPRSDAFPFDYVQNSSAYAGDPVYISHFSKDKAWVFVQRSTSDAGFVKSSEVGIFPDAPPKWIQTAKLAIVLEDNTPIYDALGNFWAYSRIGMNMFVVGEGVDTYIVQLPYKDTRNNLQWIRANIPKSLVTIKPLKFTEENVKKIISQVMDQKYGWGGYFGSRDCSALIKDYLAAFMIQTARDGESQSLLGRKRVNLSHLTPEEKKKLIIKEGIPFRTTLYKDGHIVLYVGYKDGKVLILHNIWSNRLLKDGRKGQNIIGRTIISTVEFGHELDKIDSETIFINQASVMTIY